MKPLKQRHPNYQTNEPVRNVTTLYYTKNFNCKAPDLRQDQEATTTNNQVRSTADHTSNTLQQPKNTTLHSTDNSYNTDTAPTTRKLQHVKNRGSLAP